MARYHTSIPLGLFVLFLVAVFSAGEAYSQNSGPILTLTPDQVVISPDLLKNPVAFSGSGFSPKEIVVLEMVLPKGVTVKGISEGENAGIGNATADEKGEFKGIVTPLTVLNTLLQVGFTTGGQPDVKQAKPLPPGVYEIIASEMSTEKTAKARLTILPSPQK